MVFLTVPSPGKASPRGELRSTLPHAFVVNTGHNRWAVVSKGLAGQCRRARNLEARRTCRRVRDALVPCRWLGRNEPSS